MNCDKINSLLFFSSKEPLLAYSALFERLILFAERSSTSTEAKPGSPLLLALSAALALLAVMAPVAASGTAAVRKGGEVFNNLALLWSAAFGLDDSIWSTALDRSASDPVSDLLASPEFKKTITYQLCRIARDEIIAGRLSDAFIPYSENASFTPEAFDIFAKKASAELREHSPGAVSKIIERCVYFSRQ